MAKLIEDSSRVDGHFMELIICEGLRKRGFVILEQNYRVGRLEIDIIAMQGDVLCFIEVKSRSHPIVMSELDRLVTPEQQNHLIWASNKYCQSLRRVKYRTVRFDYILVYAPDKLHPKKVTHIRDAFVPTIL